MDQVMRENDSSSKKAELREKSISYVTEQEWSQVFDAETALLHGTIFPELLRPFQYNDKLKHSNYTF